MKYFFNTIKKSRGFSLVELLVVVAIMGTLATIAIPAFNNYRQTAKKTAYRTDMTSLHKGFLAFGVEIDSFCERESTPTNISFTNAGMGSLVSSKLYGKAGACEDPATVVSGCTACSGQATNNACTTHNDGQPTPASCNCNWNASAVSGPGKHNFLGFADASNCSASSDDDVRILGADGNGNATTEDTDCDLEPDKYQAGVYGHISGADYFGVSINNNGVLSNETEKSTTIATADSGCS